MAVRMEPLTSSVTFSVSLTKPSLFISHDVGRIHVSHLCPRPSKWPSVKQAKVKGPRLLVLTVCFKRGYQLLVLAFGTSCWH